MPTRRDFLAALAALPALPKLLTAADPPPYPGRAPIPDALRTVRYKTWLGAGQENEIDSTWAGELFARGHGRYVGRTKAGVSTWIFSGLHLPAANAEYFPDEDPDLARHRYHGTVTMMWKFRPNKDRSGKGLICVVLHKTGGSARIDNRLPVVEFTPLDYPVAAGHRIKFWDINPEWAKSVLAAGLTPPDNPAVRTTAVWLDWSVLGSDPLTGYLIHGPVGLEQRTHSCFSTGAFRSHSYHLFPIPGKTLTGRFEPATVLFS